ncbi:hypothetical protein COU78_05065 [Candidatus Peregrinibacteria bacterium CG10_big_fil_rev_8_21_14_0_10_49_24]|nr:MAG: hypothetical protein COV83_01435 [Candidatus Peregrinibacteria bacterium CG11_big_fil_rev_8_21_14_0_20_49_14]PIR50718.1 MAG: hypothetical protein COU78_05065 [Candidatus Peregrinibacteria bacterium CG10_big_fil_rev_8_21_14_0_10_49_24]PJA68238.1 MAG: hypothetical protein CO157_00745 [Candidatus Peregrinibacteria bacterium CG_4_9_14_3_um_filter_49_12]
MIGAFAGLLLLLTMTVYFRSLFHEFVRWDDGLLIYDNPAIRAINLSTLKRIFTSYDPELYIPLTFFSYQIDYLIGGTKPVMYHLTNLLLHTSNAFLFGWFALLLSRSRWVGVFCALLFAIHPLHTEAVAWASARKDVLSTFFFLLSLIGYVRFRETGKYKRLSIVSFALALMAKVTVATLPVLLLLIDIRENRPFGKKMLLEKIPYFALSIVFGIVAIVGKTSVLSRSHPYETMLMAFKSTAFYIEKLLVPIHLSVLYPYVGTISLSSPDFLIPFLSVLILTVLALFSLKRSREFFFCFFFFLLTISPTFINFAKGDLDFYFASDRYAYAGSVGIIFFLVGVVNTLAVKFSPKYVTAAAGGIVLVFAWMSHMQSLTWNSTESLFTNVLEHYNNSHVAYNNLGNVHRRNEDLGTAIDLYEKAIAIRDHPRTRSNLGAALRKQGRTQEALAEYEKALALDPDSKTAHFGLGILLAEQGNTSRAIQEYVLALETDPTYVEVSVNLGALYMKIGETEKAIEQYEHAIAVLPHFPQAHFNLAVAYAKLGSPGKALASYERAVALEPSFVAARINLGIAYYERNRKDEAIEQFEAVLRYDPQNKQALSALQQIRN